MFFVLISIFLIFFPIILYFFRENGLVKALWGHFESSDEVKKFISLAFMFFFMMVVYNILNSLKHAVFFNTVGFKYLPIVKMISAYVGGWLLMLYTIGIIFFKKENIFYSLLISYGIIAFICMFFLMKPDTVSASPLNLIGYFFYIFVESYSFLIIALFWVIVTSITLPKAATRGFPVIFMFGIVGTMGGVGLKPKLPGFAFPIGLCGLFLSVIGVLFWCFMRKTSKRQVASYAEMSERSSTDSIKRLISYLCGILFIVMAFDIISHTLDYFFKVMASKTFIGEIVFSKFLYSKSFYTRLITFLFLFFGINNIQRKYGIFSVFISVFILTILAVAGFIFSIQLSILFWILIVLQAVTYALYQPAIRQLFIPTTKWIRYIGQVWIGFVLAGSRFISSLILLPVRTFGFSSTVMISSFIFLGFIIVFYISKTFNRAISKNEVVC